MREKLIQAARKAAKDAYCPYSGYAVGAALLTKHGEILTGCNVENVAYGLTICAERVAVFRAVALGCREFAALALAGGKERAATPCGACRQVLAEFCAPEMQVYYADLGDGPVMTTTLGELLPLAFGALRRTGS